MSTTRLLIASLLCLVAACGRAETPPPYDLRFNANVPAEDRQRILQAAAAWNLVVGHDVLLEEPQDTECGHIRVIKRTRWRGQTLKGACNVTLEYADATDIVALLHELGHALMSGTDSDHTDDGSALDGSGQGTAYIGAEHGQLVRDHWGMEAAQR